LLIILALLFHILDKGSPPHSLCLDEVGWLAFSNDCKSYTSGSIATGRVFLARQVEAEEPE